ncbi:MAG: hypothetical protein COW52_11205, partial [Nitrospirae bacterium CG17_big_fil_post_rev_8_21_14_2_50_50_9]
KTASMVNWRYIFVCGGKPAMPKTIDAVYENGVFKPEGTIAFKEHTKVRLIVEDIRSVALSTSGIIPSRNSRYADSIAVDPEFLFEEA